MSNEKHRSGVFTQSLRIAQSAVQRQMDAIGGDVFEFGIRNEVSGEMMIRTWSRQKAIQGLSWLKYKNLRGHHIYIRPYGSSGVVLVDDISRGGIALMEEKGVIPACVIESSPLNHQVWVRVSVRPIPPTLASAVGEVLQVEFGGDPNSKDWRHFGRSVGFTNVKPKHVMENGFYPFVKLISAPGGLTPNATDILERAHQLLIYKEQAALTTTRYADRTTFKETPQRPLSLAYKEAGSYIVEKFGRELDASRADFAVAKHLLIMGYSLDDLEEMMRNDDCIRHRKKGHVEDYVSRTLSAAVKQLA